MADREVVVLTDVMRGVHALGSLWTVRVLAMLAAALTAWLVAVEARRRYGRRAAWMAGLLCVFALVAFAPQEPDFAGFADNIDKLGELTGMEVKESQAGNLGLSSEWTIVTYRGSVRSLV